MGSLVSGFYLLPQIGLNLSLSLIALLNLAASLVFIGNKQEGTIVQKEKPQSIPSPFPNSLFFVFVFIAGSLTISYEVLFVRILNLSIGSGAYNFPIILSIFIGALACGSLSLSHKKPSISSLIYHLFLILLFLIFIFETAPYFAYWLNHIRVSLTSLPSNYPVWYILVFLFLMLFLFPPVFFMGRLLPLSYMFIKKTEKNYGKVCGFLYFANTLGTFFGSLVMGYLAFYFFDLDTIFKLNLYILLLTTMLFVFIQKNRLNFVILSLIALLLLSQPKKWDRSNHEVGLFRTRSFQSHLHFQSFFPKKSNKDIAFFKDGPNTTVSLIRYELSGKNKESNNSLKELFSLSGNDPLYSYSILVNGKSDGNTLGDFSTTFFMLPYLYSAKKTELKTGFIGLGTGMSAGAYTPLKEVKSIDVLEISPYVVQAVKKIEPKLNFNVMESDKVKIIQNDAFKHFTKSKKKYDIIISEPSNPWVMGVENLYTKEFYAVIKERLYQDGIFAQWIHTYDIDNSTLELVFKTVYSSFPHATLYRVGAGDILVVASSAPLTLKPEKFTDPFVKKIYRTLGVYQLEDLYLSQILNQEEMRQMALLSRQEPNSLYSPQMIYRTNKSFFLSSSADTSGLIYKPYYLERKELTQKQKVFEKLKNKNWRGRCLNHSGFDFLCRMTLNSINLYDQLQATENKDQHFSIYLKLRKKGLIPYNPQTLSQIIEENLKRKKAQFLSSIIYEILHIGDYEKTWSIIKSFKKAKIIDEEAEKQWNTEMDSIRRLHKKINKN